MKNITKEQEKAASLVRSYILDRGLSLEDTRTTADGVIMFLTSDRDESDIYDERPSAATKEQFRDYVKALRDLSPLVYVAWEEIDEWINLTISIRSTPRKQRPAEIPKLVEKVIAGLPDTILKHPRVTGVCARGVDGVDIRTDVPGPVGSRIAMLSWGVAGSSVVGWHLVVDWGVHSVTRPAKFKKLTPKIVLAELDRITSQLDNPLNCLGHTITAKREGWFLCRNGKPETFAKWEALSDDGAVVKAPRQRADTVVFINNLTGDVTELSPGDRVPVHIKPIK